MTGILSLLSPQPQISLSSLQRWLVIRCSNKIKERLRTRAKCWSKVPWEIMKDWKGPMSDDIIESSWIEVSTNAMTYLPLTKLPRDGENVLLDRDTVQKWIVGLGKLLSLAHDLYAENDKESLFRLHNLLTGAFFLLHLPQIQKILCATPSLVRDFDGAQFRQS